MNATLVQVQRAIDFIEARLFEELPLHSVAAAAAASPWHFHRLFGAITGETPATYVWKRRLCEICQRLVNTDDRLVDIALDSGFESQATFTRAFTRHVGVSPGRYRKERLMAPAHLYPMLELATLVARQRRESMESRIEKKPAIHVVGMAGHFTLTTNTRIPELWARFAPCIDTVPNRQGRHTLGICVDADPSTVEEAGFTYVAAVEVESIGSVPNGMTALTIPAHTYAVFTHRGHISRLKDTVKQVWGRWLPQSPYRHVPAPDFEWYDERFNPITGDGEVDIFVPIAEQ